MTQFSYEQLVSAGVSGDFDYIQSVLDHNKDLPKSILNMILPYAAKHGHAECLKMLVNQGADLHHDDEYTFREAVRYRKFEAIKFCVEHGADVAADDNWAVRNSAIIAENDLLKYLLEHGGDASSFKKDDLRRLFSHISFQDSQLSFEIVTSLYETGLDIALDHYYVVSQIQQDKKDALQGRNMHAYLSDLIFLDHFIGRAPAVDAAKPLAEQLQQVLPFTFQYPLGSKRPVVSGKMTGLQAKIVNREFETVLENLDQMIDLDMNGDFLVQSGVSLQYILRRTGQLDLLFQQRFWANDDGQAAIEKMDKLYYSLNSYNRRFVQDSYAALREKKVLQDQLYSLKGQGDKVPKLKRRRKSPKPPRP